MRFHRRADAGGEDDVVPGVGPVELEEVALRVELGAAEVRVGRHPGFEALHESLEEGGLPRWADQKEAGDFPGAGRVDGEGDSGHQLVAARAHVTQPGVIQGGPPGPRPARDHDPAQRQGAHLLAPEARRHAEVPAREARREGLLEQVVLVAREILMHGAELRHGAGEELLLQGAGRAVGVLPPVEGLGDLKQAGPGGAVPVTAEALRRGTIVEFCSDCHGAPPGERVDDAPRVPSPCGI